MFNNRICYTFLCVEYNPYFRVVVFIPAFFEEKKGLCVTVRHPSVCPSVRLSVRQQFTSISSYTIDARITKHMHDTPMHTDVDDVFEIFLRLPVLK